ncbi:hypothetical protein DMI82_04475 [Blautia sp. BCRC 81119]|nr:hypothetical protein DMI82_04475 [Blautia sp. BCRC 81119]
MLLRASSTHTGLPLARGDESKNGIGNFDSTKVCPSQEGDESSDEEISNIANVSAPRRRG